MVATASAFANGLTNEFQDKKFQRFQLFNTGTLETFFTYSQYPISVIRKMLASHPKIDLPILHLVGEEADRLGLECYVIGGYVRDIFLHRDSTDIDVVVVGSGIDLAQRSPNASERVRTSVSSKPMEQPRLSVAR